MRSPSEKRNLLLVMLILAGAGFGFLVWGLPSEEPLPLPEPPPGAFSSGLSLEALRPRIDDAVRHSVESLWTHYLLERDGEPAGLEDFRRHLDHIGVPLGTSAFHGRNLVSTLDEILASTDLEVDELKIHRIDAERATEFRVSLDLVDRAKESRGRLAFSYEARGRSFKGLDFALLANTVNCLMCHAEIDNAARVYSRDLLAAGSHERVRVGTLKHLQVRSGAARSRIAGTLYTRGLVLNESGAPLDIAASTLTSARFDREGRLIEDVWGGLVEAPLVSARRAGGNFYVEYPLREADQIDGVLPRRFPSVFGDRDRDHRVDDEEFLAATKGAEGSVRGGFKVKVAPGERYSEGGLPKRDLAGDLEAVISGNLVLRGTMLDPIRIEGAMVVDGDLVIAGRVRGSGSLLVRGNVYVVDSLVYADATDAEGRRIFGRTSDGEENRLAIAAGGSIVLGDPLANTETYSKGLVTGRRDGALNFTMSELLLFNRLEWTPTQERLPGRKKSVVDNPLHDPEHRPRYYVLREGDPVYVMNRPDKDAIWFDPEIKAWAGIDAIGDWSWGGWTEYGPETETYREAEIQSLLPGEWLDDSSYRGMLNAAAASGRGFEVDGLLYTDNALILAAPRKGVYEGRATVNGSLIAADLGVFAPGDGKSAGFRLNYDARVGQIIDIRSERHLEIR